MEIFKCKMCGGSLNVNENESYTTCEYCGTKQTLPKLDNDERANLYDRANHFRRNNEYDKASAIYEQILNQDSSDSEAYWSLVLCRYGIEYVEDPTSRKRIPTVNRAQFTSIYADENYKQAIEHADGYQKEIYETEASIIDEIQKNILSISQKESPFDVFICYKETDDQGRRTVDSVLANDLYHQLSQEGFKVFFSRITLEEKLGSAYEPYIFAALNSAKIMVVLGTKPEYFKAVWVRNEWSRYLGLIKSGAKKMLIPAYKGVDPYDLPEEFSHLQALDMSKLGFMQDLIRGIKKIIEADKPKEKIKETVVIGSSNANIIPLLKRTKLFLEDSNWREVNSYTERVLDIEPENATAYLYKMMAELKITHLEKLEDLQEPFEDNSNYQKVLRFGEDELINTLKGYINSINGRKEQGRLQTIYQNGLNYMDKGDLSNAIIIFDKIPNFKDSIELRTKCIEKQEENRKDKIYYSAFKEFQLSKIPNLENAIKQFESISGWKDSDQKIQESKKKIEEIKAKEEADKLEKARIAEERRIAAIARKQKIKKIAVIAIPSVIMIITFLILLFNVFIPNSKYNQALELINEGKYEEANLILEELEGYSDAQSQIIIIEAHKEFKAGNYEEAINLIEEIGTVEITYNLDGGQSLEPLSMSFNLSVTNKIPFKTGYQFIGWELETYSINNEKDNYSADVSLKAKWSINQYTISFNSNGGTLVESIIQDYDTALSEPNNPTKEGYQFIGWFEDEEFTKEYLFTTMPAIDMTLYARWLVNPYTITFVLNGGIGEEKLTEEYGSSIEELIPTKEGYTFGGWYVNETLTSKYEFTTMPAEDFTLYAKWRLDPHTITLELNGGIGLTEIYDDFDTELIEPIPSREGYTFIGWYSDIELTQEYVFTTMPAEDITVYAKWTPVEYNIIYNLNGGTNGLNQISYTIETDKVTLLPATKKGYTFLGWYFDEAFSGEVITEIITLGTMGEITLYAKWAQLYEFFTIDNMTYVYYGTYPQTVVDDSSLISSLNSLTSTNANGYYEFEGEEYAKVVADPYNTGYKFINGSTIQPSQAYYFKVEPIKWRVLEEADGTYTLLSEYIIDKQVFYTSLDNRTIGDQTIYANNYEHSTIREWLNNAFYNKAFSTPEKVSILTTLVDNSASTTASSTNPYFSNNTMDKVYLLSYQEARSSAYGFSTSTNSSSTRTAVTTDYARAVGAYMSTSTSYYGNGFWWLRSPYISSSYYAHYVHIDGNIIYDNIVYISINGARPAIKID